MLIVSTWKFIDNVNHRRDGVIRCSLSGSFRVKGRTGTRSIRAETKPIYVPVLGFTPKRRLGVDDEQGKLGLQDDDERRQEDANE